MRYRLAIDAQSLTGPEGMSLAGGRYVATVVSAKTGVHLTVRFSCKRPPRGSERRWQPCRFVEAERVFADIPRGSDLLPGTSPGVFLPAEGIFRSTAGADPARVWAALFALRVAGGQPHSGEAFVMHSTNCLHCGRELTDPESIQRSLGPECYGKLTKSQHQRSPLPQPLSAARGAELEELVGERWGVRA